MTSEYAFAISWRWLINLEQTELIIFHDSLLPRYRGFGPLVSSLINGDHEIGVTALFSHDEYDKGDIIAQDAKSITYPLTIQQAIDTITDCYVSLATEITSKIMRGHPLDGQPQEEADASYSLWRDDQDYHIDWTKSAAEIKRFVDAVSFPYKGAFTLINNRPARVLEADALGDVHIENRTPGKIIFVQEGHPIVVCGSGLLRVCSAVSDNEDGEEVSLLPLNKFRTRFS